MKKNRIEIIQLILNVIKVIPEIIISICVIILWKMSSKDPFDNHIIGEMSNYFSENSETYIINTRITNSNDSFNYSYIEKNKFQKLENISSDIIINSKPFLKRKLTSGSFCADIQYSFERNKGRKLSYIFDLNYKIVRNISISIFVLCLCSDGFLFLIVICGALTYYHREKNKNLKCDKILLYMTGTIILIIWIARFILSLLLYHYIEDGDIGKYDEFLDCRNVKEKYFDKFTDVNKFRRVFLTFAIVNIISESIDKINDALELIENGLKEEKRITEK